MLAIIRCKAKYQQARYEETYIFNFANSMGFSNQIPVYYSWSLSKKLVRENDEFDLEMSEII